MAQEKDLSSYFKKSIGPLVGACLVFYFTYHLLNGDRGIFSWRRLEVKVNQAQTHMDQLDTFMQTLETKVNLLRPESLDPDLLEQRSKEVLGLKYENELTLDARDFLTND